MLMGHGHGRCGLRWPVRVTSSSTVGTSFCSYRVVRCSEIVPTIYQKLATVTGERLAAEVLDLLRLRGRHHEGGLEDLRPRG